VVLKPIDQKGVEVELIDNDGVYRWLVWPYSGISPQSMAKELQDKLEQVRFIPQIVYRGFKPERVLKENQDQEKRSISFDWQNPDFLKGLVETCQAAGVSDIPYTLAHYLLPPKGIQVTPEEVKTRLEELNLLRKEVKSMAQEPLKLTLSKDHHIQAYHALVEAALDDQEEEARLIDDNTAQVFNPRSIIRRRTGLSEPKLNSAYETLRKRGVLERDPNDSSRAGPGTWYLHLIDEKEVPMPEVKTQPPPPPQVERVFPQIEAAPLSAQGLKRLVDLMEKIEQLLSERKDQEPPVPRLSSLEELASFVFEFVKSRYYQTISELNEMIVWTLQRFGDLLTDEQKKQLEDWRLGPRSD
jgi:hypothetical protein